MDTLTLFANHLRAIADFIQSTKAGASKDVIDTLVEDIHLTCDVFVERLEEHKEELVQKDAEIRELTFIVKNAPDRMKKRMDEVRRLYLLEQQHRRDGARIRELEEAIRKFLEADMELDDMESFGKSSPTLSQKVNKARRELLDIMPPLRKVR